MTGKKLYTQVRAALMSDEEAFASALARSQRPFVKLPDPSIRLPGAEQAHRYYAWATGETGEAPYLLYAGRPRKEYRRYAGGNNVLVVATSLDDSVTERLVSDFVTQTGIPLGNHLPENVVRMNSASMNAGFHRFLTSPVEFLQMFGLAFPSEKI